MRRQIGFALVLLLVAATATAAEIPDHFYLDELIRRASDAHLSSERYWHLLLHYRENFWGGYTSEADGPGFFLAPSGKTDPEAELEATLAKFFSDELVGRSRQPAQCAFIARYHWLKERLAIDDGRLPPQSCPRFVDWIGALDPDGVSFIFPSAFMNNPSSMFGHTLLRIDQKGQTEQTRILAYTINYAAEVTTYNPFSYTLLGVFGQFKGYFSTMPYYLKVQEYRDFENRDIWEYRLNLTAAQIGRMLMHAWELGNTYFDYYFFKENCAYHILSLLEVADPNLHLTDQFTVWTIPADTVRLIARQPGLVGDVVFRPSLRTTMRSRYAGLSDEEARWFERIRRDASEARSEGFRRLPPDRQAFVLDVVSHYLRYRSVTDEASSATYKATNLAVLAVRSELRVRSDDSPVTPATAPPEQGHQTRRVGLGGGWREDSFFEEVTFRPAYHDLLDPERGYTPDAQIEFLAVSVRHYERRDQYRLERVRALDILSLTPMDALVQRPSWKLSAGMESVRHGPCRYCSAGNGNLGLGAAVESKWLRREVYFAFAELDANYSRAFAERHRAGGGGTIGLLADLTEPWKIMLSATYLRFPLGERSDVTRISLQQRYTLRKDLALRLEFNHRDHHDNEALLTLQAYF